MNNTEFEQKFENLIDDLRDKLSSKAKEYAVDQDRLINFRDGARISEQYPELVLDGYMLKHYVSYRDMLKLIKSGGYPSLEVIDEKLGDIIIYFILQKIMMEDKISF